MYIIVIALNGIFITMILLFTNEWFLGEICFPPHFISDFVWLATGGMHGCFNKNAIKVLGARDIILFPDLGATDKWKSKIPLLQSVCKRVVISNILEDNATDEQKTKGLDIADFLLMTETPQMALQRLIKQHPPLQHLIDSLGLVLVEES